MLLQINNWIKEEWINELMDECVSAWMNERASEWMNWIELIDIIDSLLHPLMYSFTHSFNDFPIRLLIN